MSNIDKNIQVNSFTLKSATDIPDTLAKIHFNDTNNLLIHIVSFIHNTVLVQNLKKDISKMFPQAKIVLLKHANKSQTALTIFNLTTNIDPLDISDEILKELHLDVGDKDSSIQDYRKQLFSRYFTDHLTNLPNVYQLRKDLQEKEKFTFFILNIDNFQTINNFYGFIVGDYVIEAVGKELKSRLPKHKIYKLSGDEFAFILDESMGFYDLKKYLNQLYNSLNNILVNYQDIKIFVDLTIASSSNHDTTNIFSKVSMALKYAKDMKLPFWIYEDKMHFENEYERNLQLSSIVRDAVENSRIVPYFQAIVDNKTDKIIKYECLARLIDKNGKILSPVLFIPVSKKIKVYSILTKIIIDKSFEMFENSELEFNVNLSIEDIMSGEIFQYIIDKLKSSKASSRVTFEILESEAIQDFKKVERFIGEVRRYGAKIAIDDFGSGYSNFSYLTRISPDYIKIDGSLIKNIDVDKTAYLVVETIVAFAKKLGIKTVAEYVHSSIIMDYVKELGIDYSQGFYIDEPSIKMSE
ncbi:MAG: diguanylate cyclase [Epsilonproteobacteria bacterium]|nr:MAG: diguanylate cyclase [Campylobacterota bacterium]